MDNDDLYMIYLNSSNVGEDNNGNPIQAENDANFTTNIRPLTLNPNNEWVVGVVDMNYYNVLNNTTTPTLTFEAQLPVNVYSDVGIFVRNGYETTDLLYQASPPDVVFTQPYNLYFGEKNLSSIVGWRPIQNKSITQINMRFETIYGDEVKWDGTGLRGFNSITLAIMKVN
tara:strand:+ start:235 stop:747 length:513 start_codon:yes stop_codon:yes gene_type:complete